MFTESKQFKKYEEDGRPAAGMSAFELGMPNIGRFWLPRGQVEAKALLDALERKDIYTAAGGTFTAPAFGNAAERRADHPGLPDAAGPGPVPERRDRRPT
jgi:hypothetical protein